MKARKVNPLITAINEQIKYYKDESKSSTRKAKRLAENRMLLRATYGSLVNGLDSDNGRVDISWIGRKPYISVYLYSLDGLKDVRLTSLLSNAMDIISMNVQERDVATYGYKRYTLDSEQINFEIIAHVKDDSPTCKRVVVKREMQEVLTTQFVCE